MAITNWKIEPPRYSPGLVDAIEGRTWWVDGTNPAALDIDGGGYSPQSPLRTLAWAAARAQPRDVIVLCAGHVEYVLPTAPIQFTNSDVTVRGLGRGPSLAAIMAQPGQSAMEVCVDAQAGVWFDNVRFSSQSGELGTMVAFRGGSGTQLRLTRCAFECGPNVSVSHMLRLEPVEDTAGAEIADCEFHTVEGVASAVLIAAPCARVLMTRCISEGSFSSAVLQVPSGTATSHLLAVDDCALVNTHSDGRIVNVENETPTLVMRGRLVRGETLCPAVSGDNVSVVSTDILPAVPQESEAPVGTIFHVLRSVVHNTIVTTAPVNLTTAATGPLLLEQCILQNGNTPMASAQGNAKVTLLTTNTWGAGPFMHVLASLIGQQAVFSRDAVLGEDSFGNAVVLEQGARVQIRAAGENVTSNGTVVVNMIFRRLAAGAQVTAA